MLTHFYPFTEIPVVSRLLQLWKIHYLRGLEGKKRMPCTGRIGTAEEMTVL